MATRYQILKNLLLRNWLWDSNFFFHRNVCQWTVFQIPSKNFVLLKNMVARGRGHFSMYGYFVNLSIFSISLPQLLQNASYLRTLKNTDMTIASMILKLLSSNSTYLFSITQGNNLNKGCKP